MALYFKESDQNIIFFGDTFRHRPTIKALGAKFNGVDKTWILPNTEEFRTLAATIASPVNGSKDKPQDTVAKNPLSEKTTLLPQDHTALGITVGSLLNDIERTITQSFVAPIWVLGEIQSLNRKQGQLVFFELADGKSSGHKNATITVKCHLWPSNFEWIAKRHGKETLDRILADGNQLRALVHVRFFKDRGQVTLAIEDIDPQFTQGALALARQELLKKLRIAGLDQKNKNCAPPSFPLRVGLITAEGSRAYSDFVHQLFEVMHFPGTVIYAPSSMQGEKVPQDVCKALEALKKAQVDLVVISRGGGSAADLRWFDAEEIAVAVAHYPVPVIAAIGHHDDQSIVEEICFAREKTPTAAADRICEMLRGTRNQINERAHLLAGFLNREMTRFEKIQNDLKERMFLASAHYFERNMEHLNQISRELVHTSERFIELRRSHLQSSALQLSMAFGEFYHRQTQTLMTFTQNLTKLDPSPWLNAGWTQLSHGGRPLRSIEDTHEGDQIQARMKDGILVLNVESKQIRIKKDQNL